MSTTESKDPISMNSLVLQDANESLSWLPRDLREIASGASRAWVNNPASMGGDPEEFGRNAAKVYLAALRTLNAGFAQSSEGSKAEL